MNSSKRFCKTQILYFKYSTECNDILFLLQGFFPGFWWFKKSNPVIGTVSKYSLTMLVALPPSCRTAITRIARTVLAQSPASEMNLSTPQAFLTVENVLGFFTKLRIL